MAQVQFSQICVGVPVADSAFPTSRDASLGTFNANINSTLDQYQALGYDLVSAIYVPSGPIPASIQLFFIRQ